MTAAENHGGGGEGALRPDPAGRRLPACAGAARPQPRLPGAESRRAGPAWARPGALGRCAPPPPPQRREDAACGGASRYPRSRAGPGPAWVEAGRGEGGSRGSCLRQQGSRRRAPTGQVPRERVPLLRAGVVKAPIRLLMYWGKGPRQRRAGGAPGCAAGSGLVPQRARAVAETGGEARHRATPLGPFSPPLGLGKKRKTIDTYPLNLVLYNATEPSTETRNLTAVSVAVSIAARVAAASLPQE